MDGVCPRCGEDRGAGRWCASCGLDSTPTVATLPTQEAMDAGNREKAWFGSNPEQARVEEEQRQAAIARTERAEYQRLASAQPAGLDAYRDVAWRARLARAWLVIVAALTLLGAVLEISHLRLLSGKATADLDLELAQRVDDSNATLGVVYLVTLCALLFSAVFFISWTYRSYRNMTALGADRPRYGAGWAIGAWFVPFLGMWRPKEIINDIWRTSEPDDRAVLRPDQWRDRAVPGWLALWWGLYLCSAFADRLSARLGTDTIEHDRTATTWSLIASVLTIASAGLAYLVVTRITARQRARAAALEALPTTPVSGSPPRAATARAT
jgi:hypothetical protein